MWQNGCTDKRPGAEAARRRPALVHSHRLPTGRVADGGASHRWPSSPSRVLRGVCPVEGTCRSSAYLRMVGLASCGGDLGGSKSGVRPMPILARDESGAGCRVGAASDGSFQSGARRLPRLRRNRERVKASPVGSGCGELELAQGVEGAFADLAGDGQSRHRGVASRAGGAVEREVGGGRAVRVHGGFDQRPAQMR